MHVYHQNNYPEFHSCYILSYQPDHAAKFCCLIYVSRVLISVGLYCNCHFPTANIFKGCSLSGYSGNEYVN